MCVFHCVHWYTMCVLISVFVPWTQVVLDAGASTLALPLRWTRQQEMSSNAIRIDLGMLRNATNGVRVDNGTVYPLLEGEENTLQLSFSSSTSAVIVFTLAANSSEVNVVDYSVDLSAGFDFDSVATQMWVGSAGIQATGVIGTSMPVYMLL